MEQYRASWTGIGTLDEGAGARAGLESDGVEKGRWRSKAFGSEGRRDNWHAGGGGPTPEMNEREGGVRTA